MYSSFDLYQFYIFQVAKYNSMQFAFKFSDSTYKYNPTISNVWTKHTEWLIVLIGYLHCNSFNKIFPMIRGHFGDFPCTKTNEKCWINIQWFQVGFFFSSLFLNEKFTFVFTQDRNRLYRSKTWQFSPA